MKKAFFRIFLAIFLINSVSLFGYEFADPKPTIENPRKIVFQANSNPVEFDKELNFINNILRAYEPEKVSVSVVVFGKGISLLQKKQKKHITERVKALMGFEVEFIACRNTMQSKHLSDKDMIDGISYVQAGIPEIIERQVKGWVYVKP